MPWNPRNSNRTCESIRASVQVTLLRNAGVRNSTRELPAQWGNHAEKPQTHFTFVRHVQLNYHPSPWRCNHSRAHVRRSKPGCGLREIRHFTAKPIVGQFEKQFSQWLESKSILADYSFSSIHVPAEARNLQTDSVPQCRTRDYSAIQRRSEYVRIQSEIAFFETDRGS